MYEDFLCEKIWAPDFISVHCAVYCTVVVVDEKSVEAFIYFEPWVVVALAASSCPCTLTKDEKTTITIPRLICLNDFCIPY